MKFGESKWIPIFRGGKQTDSLGVEHDGDALIEKAVATFNPTYHEPPVVIGHPKENAPAYGWVEGLKKEAVDGVNLLLARFRQVQPAFADMVNQGLFKKRSAAFYPDGSLRHVGFLGAMPPAVKGLPDAAFKDGEEAATFDFSEDWKMDRIAGVFRSLREWLLEKFDPDTADRIIPNWTIDDIKTPPPEAEPENATYSEKEEKPMLFKEFLQKLKDLITAADTIAPDTSGTKTFSETDVATAVANERSKVETEIRQKMEKEFAEKNRLDLINARKQGISGWCEAMVGAGKMTPAMIKYGMPEFLMAFAEREDVIEFGETKEKATLFDRFKGFFETELPRLVEFKEVATRDKDAGGTGGAGSKVEALIQEKMKADKNLTYSAAFSEVQREKPDLALEYAQEIRG